MSEKINSTVLCGANSYTRKYYLNPEFNLLPETVKKELQIMCVTFTENVGGQLTLEFDAGGNLQFRVAADDVDYLFDEIESGMLISDFQRKKREILEEVELFYKIIILKMN